MVNSGSSANLLALSASLESRGISPDSSHEVIITAVSWATTYFPCHQLGLSLRIVDVDLDELNSPVEAIEAAINDDTIAIFAVNLLGNPSDLFRLRELANKHDLILLEDNCESMGALLDGKYSGTFGDIGTFSTYFSHHINTIEGGFCLTDDLKLYEYMKSMRSHGWMRDLPMKNTIADRSADEDDSFLFALPGYNFRPMEIQGALGVEQLKKLPDFISQRRANAGFFMQITDHLTDEYTFQAENGSASWFGFSVVAKNFDAHAILQLRNRLEQSGIATRPIVAGNIMRHPVAKRLRIANPGVRLPISDRIHESGFFIGNHHYDISAELENVSLVLAQFANT